jgi:N utilization substance protein A
MASGRGEAVGVKLTGEEMQYIRQFTQLTGVMPKDCVIEEDRIIFVVGAGKVGQVIGKGGMNIKQVKEMFQRDVNVVAHAEKLEEFAKNTLAPAKVTKVEVVEKRNGKTMLVVDVAPEDRGKAIGKNGRNIARARMLVKRHFGIENIVLS